MSPADTKQPWPNDRYTQDSIKGLLKAAVADLYEHEHDIDHFSSETRQTEWNLAAHLAPEIVKYFDGYNYDIDVMKVNYGNRRPDIIIHRRGTSKYDLLVVEVKREGSSADTRRDAQKIQEYWFDVRLRYRFGATINLEAGKLPDIDVFRNPSLGDC